MQRLHRCYTRKRHLPQKKWLSIGAEGDGETRAILYTPEEGVRRQGSGPF